MTLTAFRDPAPSASDLVNELLAKQAADDPQLQQLMGLLGLGVAPATQRPPEHIGTDLAAGLDTQRANTLRVVSTLDGEMRRCYALIDEIAAALGACRRCLGRDPTCDQCGGAGEAGSGPIDEPSFRGLFQPLLDQMAVPAEDIIQQNGSTP